MSAAAGAVVLDNGDWDGGLADLSDPAAAGIPTWLIRARPGAGGLVPDAALPAFAALIGADHIITLAGAPARTAARRATASVARRTALLAERVRRDRSERSLPLAPGSATARR